MPSGVRKCTRDFRAPAARRLRRFSTRNADCSRGRNCFAAGPSGSRNSTRRSRRETSFPFDLRRARRGSFGCTIQLAQRIHEERGAAADFVAQHGDARARHVEGFNDHVLQFVAQELFDGAFVFRLDFGIIGQHADGAEAVADCFAALARQKVSAPRRPCRSGRSESARPMRAAPGRRRARRAALRSARVASCCSRRRSAMRACAFRTSSSSAARALGHGLPVQVGGLRAFAMVQRFLEQLLFRLFVARHAPDVMRQRLLRLRLVAVQARQFVAEFGG